MILKVKRLCEDAILPKYAHESDAALDVYSVEEKNLIPGETTLVKTGIAVEIDNNTTEIQVRPRSGLALKNSITVLNTPGTVDSGYRGEIGVILINLGKEPFAITKGMRIAQLVVSPIIKVKIEEVNTLSESDRNGSGFGSTGLK